MDCPLREALSSTSTPAFGITAKDSGGAVEQADAFDVIRLREQIKRRDLPERVTALDKTFRVARQCGRVARDVGDHARTEGL